MEGTPQQAGFLTTFATSNPDAAYIAIDGPKSTAGYEPKLKSGWYQWMDDHLCIENL